MTCTWATFSASWCTLSTGARRTLRAGCARPARAQPGALAAHACGRTPCCLAAPLHPRAYELWGCAASPRPAASSQLLPLARQGKVCSGAAPHEGALCSQELRACVWLRTEGWTAHPQGDACVVLPPCPPKRSARARLGELPDWPLVAGHHRACMRAGSEIPASAYVRGGPLRAFPFRMAGGWAADTMHAVKHSPRADRL